MTPFIYIQRCLLAAVLLCTCNQLAAHGSVVAEDDLCLIEIGFYSAHFTIFQPQTRQHQEYCEDIPDATESVFIMEYLHDSMREVPVDFRIIRDRHSKRQFVKWDDIEALGDLEPDTVFYQPPVTKPDGVFAILHHFDVPGDYIGIVTASHPTKDLHYRALFPFRVGGFSWDYWPIFIALLLLVQLNYWVMGGDYKKLLNKRQQKHHI